MPKLFISYSHKDEKALEKLHKHLAMLRREGLIEAWFDREILAGDNIDAEIKNNLATSDFFIALVSPDFIASDYCYEKEMKEAIGRHDEGTIRVIPVIAEPCDWTPSPLGKLKALPKDGQPISTWANENVAYLDVATQLRRLLSATETKAAASTRPATTEVAPRAPRGYRVKKEFDTIDKEDFRKKTFETIAEYFQKSIHELNEVGDPIRARFEMMGDGAFTCTVLNKGMGARSGEAHITVHAHSQNMFKEISYHFGQRTAANTANGHIRVEANEYAMHLRLDSFGFGVDRKKELTPDEAAEELWKEFISHAGIEHA